MLTPLDVAHVQTEFVILVSCLKMIDVRLPQYYILLYQNFMNEIGIATRQDDVIISVHFVSIS